MKQLSLAVITLFTTLCLSAAEPPATTETRDSLASEYSPNLTAEQMLFQMQKQMTELQVKIDQIQSTLSPENKAKKEIIPVEEKNTSHFYWGIQFGCFFSNNQYTVSQDVKENLGTRFSFVIKPSVGYNFTPRLNVGCKFIFANCQFAGMDYASFQYLIASSLIGAGAYPYDNMTWNIQPFIRYKLTKLFWEKVNLWAELSAYAGQMIPRDSKTRELQHQNRSTIYGVALRPMITIDLNKNMMFFTSLEFLSWNGSTLVSGESSQTNNSVNFQFIPIYSLISGLFNLGIIRRF